LRFEFPSHVSRLSCLIASSLRASSFCITLKTEQRAIALKRKIVSGLDEDLEEEENDPAGRTVGRTLEAQSSSGQLEQLRSRRTGGETQTRKRGSVNMSIKTKTTRITRPQAKS
jgi:hypothetical protein